MLSIRIFPRHCYFKYSIHRSMLYYCIINETDILLISECVDFLFNAPMRMTRANAFKRNSDADSTAFLSSTVPWARVPKTCLVGSLKIRPVYKYRPYSSVFWLIDLLISSIMKQHYFHHFRCFFFVNRLQDGSEATNLWKQWLCFILLWEITFEYAICACRQ